MFFCSIGLTALTSERKAQLRALAQQSLPGDLYNGHPYTTCFYFESEPILMHKQRDGTLELSLTTDGPELFRF